MLSHTHKKSVFPHLQNFTKRANLSVCDLELEAHVEYFDPDLVWSLLYVFFQQVHSMLWVCYIIAAFHSEKFCRCHPDIMIYRHACQDQDILSSSMAIAMHVAKTCAAEARFHHADCLRKHFQEDTASVSACIPALSCCHSTVNGYLSWQGRI